MANELMTGYQRLAGVRLNMVVDESLRFTGSDHSSRSITNPTDKALLIHLRSISDLVITDAATAFAESYKQSKLVPIDVWSESANFRGLDAIVQDATKKPMTFSRIDNPAEALGERSAGGAAILLETGPTLTRKIAELDLIDEVCLTVSNVHNLAAANRVCHEFVQLMNLGNFIVSHLVESQGATYIRLNRPNGVA